MDPETRRQSFMQDEIPEDSHRDWYARTCLDPDQRLFIAESGTSRVGIGVGRLDWRSGRCEVSYTVAPECRGQGVAAKIICALYREAAKLGHLRPIARVKAGNIASVRALEKAGYRLKETMLEFEYSGLKLGD